MAAFRTEEQIIGGTKKEERRFEQVVSSTDIFSDRGFSWGARDKIYSYDANRRQVEVVRYTHDSKKQPRDRFKNIGSIPLDDENITLDEWKGDVIDARVTPFGTVVECDNALVVLKSNGAPETIPGEPVNWRVFSRSKDYKNQLHIIYDDRLEIWSFNHDYFVNQTAKLAGSSMSS